MRKEPELLTIRDVAELAQVSDKTVRRAISRGELPAYKVGASVRVFADDFRRWLEPVPVIDTALAQGLRGGRTAQPVIDWTKRKEKK